jgi:hypothetical protein
LIKETRVHQRKPQTCDKSTINLSHLITENYRPDFETGKEMFSTRDDMALLLDGGVTNLRSPEIEVYNVICYIFDIFMDHANYYTIN